MFEHMADISVHLRSFSDLCVCVCLHIRLCIYKGVCKSTSQFARLGRQHTQELDENSSTFLPAMPLIS